MTSALLDTHALVWALTDPARLGTRARGVITDPTTTLLVSAASAWELCMKVRIGKFADAEPLVAQYFALVEKLRAAHLAITPHHALRVGNLKYHHRDPFDRMLAAQAALENIALITCDRVFLDFGVLDVIW